MPSSAEPKLSEDLRAGRRALEGLPGVNLLRDWTWDDSVGRWVFHCRLSPPVAPSGPVPAATDWYVLVDASYPWGTITFFPAKQGGLTETFQHQNYNGTGAVDVPWRTGDPCLDTTLRVLRRQAYDSEPFDMHSRLRWRFERVLDWLVMASRGELAMPGDPFELPQFPVPTSHDLLVAFTEDPASFDVWQEVRSPVGRIQSVGIKPGTQVVTHFMANSSRTLYEPRWGHIIAWNTAARAVGLWLRLEAVPVLPPWQAPATWGELRVVCLEQGIDLDQILKPAVGHLRDGRRHVALIGFPIPPVVGVTPTQIHWQALLLPRLSRGTQAHRGFRPNEEGYWRLDRKMVLRDEDALEWLPSENWHADQLATRGRFSQAVTAQKAAIVGAGAIGSAVAELLIRAGMHRLVVIDDEDLTAGNLTRHTLALDEVGLLKASAMAARLNRLSPHAAVTAVSHRFPPVNDADREELRNCQLVIDCTGDDTAAYDLNQFPWDEPRLFVSLSLSLGARRLYCFAAYGNTFPNTVFREAVAPWLAKDMEERAGEPLPREGIGCWHPVFPARADDVWLMVSVAVKHLIHRVSALPSEPELAVFEQQLEDGLFVGVRRAETTKT